MSDEKGRYEAPVMQNFFARWRPHATNRWSRIHWFIKGEPACGLPEPDGEYDLSLPPEPVITCVRCQRLNREAMAT